MAWLSGWGKRVKLTIDSGDIDAALSDFPILLYISASSGISSEDISCVFDELTSDENRKKIAVTLTDGTTECYVEIEKWDDGNEKAWLWVKVAGVGAIASGVDTDLYLYYDSTHADNDAYVGDTNDEVAENVWDSNFKAVYHMADGADNAHIYDSTDQDNDGEKKGANEPIVTTAGEIANAQDFDGDDDEIDTASVDLLGAVNDITVEVIFKPTSATQDRYADILDHDHSTAPNNGWVIQQDSSNHNKFYLAFHDGVGWQGTGITTQLTNGAWNHFTMVKNDTTITHYLAGSSGSNGACSADIATAANVLRFGQCVAIVNRALEGIIDEVRISDCVRNGAWIKATYETERDDLLDWGSEETEGVVYYHGLKVQGASELALCDVGTNPLRVRKGGTTYGLELVDTSDPNASTVRIKTGAGTKAIRKYT